MSPVSRSSRESAKSKATETPVSERKTPLRLFRNTFKGNQAPTTAIMLVLLLGMIAYLAPSGRSANMPDDTVARVYGRSILRRDVEQTLAESVRRMGNQPNIKTMIPFLRAQALRRTVDLKLFEEMADQRGILVTDQEVKKALETRLRQYEVFVGPNGQLRPTTEIVSILRENGIALIQWEKEVRDQLVIQKLIDQAAAQVPVDEAWITLENRVQNEQLTLEIASLTPDMAAVQDPGDGTLDAYLKASGARFQYGPRRVLQYVALGQASLGNAIKVDDAALQAAYDSRKAQYAEMDASHILFQARTEAEFAEATKKAEALREKLVAGGNFAKAAVEQSQDPSAKTNLGRLGWFRVGSMVKAFEDAAMGLKPGEISQPVRTSFGIHLIKLEGRREKPFAEVKEELRAQMMKDRFAARAKDLLEQLRKRVGDKGDLAAAAKSLNLKVQTSLPLLDEATAVLEGVPDSAALVDQAFRMKLKEVSKTLQAGEAYVVFRVQAELPIAVPPLKEIRPKVLAAWKLEQARKAATEKAKAALASGDLATLAPPSTRENITIQSLGPLGEHPAIRKALLDTAVGSLTPVLWAPDGQVMVARVKARTPAEPPTFQKRMAIVQNIQSSISQQVLEAERKALETKGRQRPGFSSLWGRFGGIWTNPQATLDAPEVGVDLGQ